MLDIAIANDRCDAWDGELEHPAVSGLDEALSMSRARGVES
ncbi:hypothetical protein [Curtobacterium flaccumfaciens]|nr:hypothetical protein [Curtobacterium flaccumfaciens]MCX2847021.1 hypothetical protein [Curtobacterium flaccumfaciens pv. oortii]